MNIILLDYGHCQINSTQQIVDTLMEELRKSFFSTQRLTH